ncbi:MAG: Beta-ketoacyl-acyl-carrier-protein synthase [Cyanobacteria bacterium RYN_339]|nr:Beta-ketoacyl-acyl-carrier-protein synthase [Cyanobacteria bacterium RYN_339]
MTRVGITKVARHLPPGRMTAADMARRTGLDEAKIRDEIGMLEKPIGAPGESALDHALKAGQALLEGLDPKSIDLLIYASGSMPDHPLWWGIYKLHELLGLHHARFLELHYGCIGSLHALEAAKSYMLANPAIKRAIVIGAEGYHFDEAFADYAYADNEPMYIFADGAAAALLERSSEVELPNYLGSFKFLVDSSKHAEAAVPGGGAKDYQAADRALRLPAQDARELKRFGIRYIQNYLSVTREAIALDGREGPDFLISSQLKLPLARILLAKLGLTMQETAYTMPKWGHVGTADILLALGEAMEQGQLKPGSTAAIVSSGVSFSWGAATLIIP